MINIEDELNSVYETLGIPFIHTSGTKYLMLDEDYESDSNQIIFRGQASSLLDVEIGDSLSSVFFRDGATFEILNDMPLGDYEEERLLSVVQR